MRGEGERECVTERESERECERVRESVREREKQSKAEERHHYSQI